MSATFRPIVLKPKQIEGIVAGEYRILRNGRVQYRTLSRYTKTWIQVRLLQSQAEYEEFVAEHSA